MAMLPWWIHYPNVNNEVINLDWILQISNENSDKIENFIGVNTIKYADPILWDITSQYEANTIVVNPQTGDAYISTKAVPYGVALSNEDYWTRIYNYASEIHVFREQIAADEQLSTTASAPRSVNDLVFLNGLLYRVTSSMITGDSYVEDSNCVKTTIDLELKREALLRIEGVNTEAQARADADTALSQRIDNEAQARADADTALGQRIDNEAQARADADTALGQRIDNEAQARADADTALGQRIDNEAQARSDADAVIRELISNISYDYIVSVDGTGDYTSLAECVSEAPSGSTILVKAGTYNNEVVNCIGKKLTIVGEDRYTTIIQNNYDDYYRPPINIGKGLISNITFKSTGTTGTTHAYAAHIDNSDLFGDSLTFDKCNFSSASTAAVGIGTRNDGILLFNNCIIETADSSAAALFVHPSGVESEGGNNQILYLINCIIHCRGANVIHIQKVGNSSNNTYVTCIGCVLQTDTLSRKNLIYQSEYQSTSEGGVYFVRGAGNSYPIMNQDTFVPGQEAASGRYNNQTIKTYIISTTLTGGTQKSISLPSDCQLITNVSGIFDDTSSGISYVIGSKAANSTDSHDVYWVNSSKTLYAYSTYDSYLTVKIEYISDDESYF